MKKIFRRLLIVSLLSALSHSAFAGIRYQDYNPALYEKIDGKYAMKNQLIVAANVDGKNEAFMSAFLKSLKSKGLQVAGSEIISHDSAKIKIVKVKLNANQSIAAMRDRIKIMPNIAWVQPNYIYNIGVDPRESREMTPNDPKIKNQYHHRLMENEKAWDISTGKNVLIAMTDDGFDTSHEDLKTRYVPNKGYNFCDNNANVKATKYDGEHGTHTSGIAAASLNNGKGGAGVAGDATLLPVKFYGEDCNWTSDLIYKAYQYAVDNGAKIISTSYNVDGFVGDKVFVAALDYVYDKGVIHFNSAGNNGEENPPRQAFEEMILVASTNDQDVKSDFSNYGKHVQISAPGEDILSTVPKNKYELMSGTSMATPNAAGSAALIWSAHPDWTRAQVAAQLIGTADNIDAKNPDYKGLMGSGRVNNYRALTEKVAPAKVEDVTFTAATATPGQDPTPNKLDIHFDKLLDADTVNQGSNWEVKSLADNSVVTATMTRPWSYGSMVLELTLPDLKPGKYQLTVKDSLKDPFGQALDGKGTGTAGSDFVYEFEVA